MVIYNTIPRFKGEELCKGKKVGDQHQASWDTYHVTWNNRQIVTPNPRLFCIIQVFVAPQKKQ